MLDIPLCKTFTGDGVCSPILSRDNAHRQYIQGRCEWPRNWLINTSIRVPTGPGKRGKMRVHLENLEISWNFEKFNKYHGKMT